MVSFSKEVIRNGLQAAAAAVKMTVDELEQHCKSRTGRTFSSFVGEEPGEYRPSFYNYNNKTLADAYDAAREAQGDPRRAFRGR